MQSQLACSLWLAAAFVLNARSTATEVVCVGFVEEVVGDVECFDRDANAQFQERLCLGSWEVSGFDFEINAGVFGEVKSLPTTPIDLAEIYRRLRGGIGSWRR